MIAQNQQQPSAYSCGLCDPRAPCPCASCHADRLREPGHPLTKAEKWIRETRAEPTFDGDRFVMHRDSRQREQYNRKFGYAVLNQATINLLKGLQPLLEVGAGLGYWAWELQQQNVDIIATSMKSHWLWENAAPWTRLEELDGEAATLKYPRRNLLMRWPDFKDQWPVRAIRAFTGEHAIIAGENRPEGCTSYEEISEELQKHYRLEAKVEIPQFVNIHDDLEIWTRKERQAAG